MSDIAIRCEGLSKRYRIGERESYKALRDVITDGVSSPFRKLRSALRNGGSSNGSALSTQHSALDSNNSALSTQHSALSTETRNSKLETRNSFWALDNVSFEVKRGEVVGIIGRNGAGKSTLLKILSRITKPTRGHARIHGRVGSLLEVGTGFHPELTGRENIYLNAAILGMRKAEVEKKFDEIVAFAEVEKFIDTPVKRYSSGMYVRLAFAVAAHMETEVLLVDEVLAVGDAEFQKKCLGKMGQVAHEGRTVLFVSHNMAAVRTLCQRALILDCGQLVFEGVTPEAIRFYSSDLTIAAGSAWVRRATAGSGPLLFETISLSVSGEQPSLKLDCELRIRCLEACARSFLAVDVCDQTSAPIMQALPEVSPFIEGLPGIHHIRLQIDLPPLIPGHYTADFWIGPHYANTLDHVRQALAFEITASPSSDRSFPHSLDHGSIVPSCHYHYEMLNSKPEFLARN